jgi:hypothetical protein
LTENHHTNGHQTVKKKFPHIQIIDLSKNYFFLNT